MPQWIHSICIKQSWISFNWPKHVISIRRWRLLVGGKSISLKDVFCYWPKLSESNCTLEDRLDGRVWIGMCRRHLLSLVIEILFFNFAVIIPLEKNK